MLIERIVCVTERIIHVTERIIYATERTYNSAVFNVFLNAIPICDFNVHNNYLKY